MLTGWYESHPHQDSSKMIEDSKLSFFSGEDSSDHPCSILTSKTISLKSQS